MPVERKEERDIYAPISEEEARSIMNEITDSIRRIMLLEEEKKETARDYKERIDATKAHQLELLGIVGSKTRLQRRLVRITYDFAAGIKYVWSPFAPNTVIATEPITDEERQAMIPQISAGADPAADGE